MNRYSYQPLPPIRKLGRTPPFTRLMTLAPGGVMDPLHCSLTIIKTENPPPFEALSYVWGKSAALSPILCDGRPISITSNLEGVLRQLRFPTQPRHLWVDAICIDQGNIEERTRQVQDMRQVYKHATRVVVWLGTKTAGFEQAFDIAQRLVKIRDAQIQDEDEDIRDALIASILSQFPVAIGFLCQLFNQEYFARTWCVQEVVSSACCIGKCSELEMNFFDLISTIPYVIPYQIQMCPQKNTLSLWKAISDKRHPSTVSQLGRVEGSMGSLLLLLAATRDFKATDPRDKIFALLGISDEGLEPILGYMHETGLELSSYFRRLRRVATGIAKRADALAPGINLWRPPALKPDYNKELVALYRDMTRFLIRKNPSFLDVLSHVQHVDDPAESFFPSWVPRWFQPRSVSILGAHKMFSAGCCNGHFALVHDNPFQREPLKPDSLQLDGFKVDKVQKVSEIMSFGLHDTIPAEAVWNQIFDVPLFPRSNRMYRNGDLLDVAFCMTLMASPFGVFATEDFAMLCNMLSKDLSKFLSTFEKQAKAVIAPYLRSNPDSKRSSHSATLQSSPPTDGNASRFIEASKMFSCNRRFYLTQSGYIGIGPMMMHPGDEVCVLFGGRAPYILRPMVQGYHVFVGETYLCDNDIMWGKAAEAVRFGKSQSRIPAMTFDLR